MVKFALVGYSRTGKDTVCDLIQKCSIPYIHRVAFGDKLKEELFKVFPDLPSKPKPRIAYEKFGQTCREIDPLVWIKKLEHTIYICEEDLDIENFIVTDCRQVNEGIWLQEQGYKLIRVNAPEEIRKERCGDEHFLAVGESEKEIDMIDVHYHIYNDGSLDDLLRQVKLILKLEGVESWALD